MMMMQSSCDHHLPSKDHLAPHPSGAAVDDEDLDESTSSASCCGGENCCGCCCGRESELREVARELDFHGIKRIIVKNKNRESNSIRSTVWLVIFLSSVAAFLYLGSGCVFVYLSEPHLTHHSASYVLDLHLPTITICNLNPLRFSEVSKRKWPTSRDLHWDGHVDELTWNSVNASSFDVFNVGAHRLNKMLLRCFAGSLPCNVSKFKILLTEAGGCYSINTNTSELRLLLNVEAYDYTDFNGGEGIGLRLVVDGRFSNDALPTTTTATVLDASTAGGGGGGAEAGAEVLLSPGRHAAVNIRRTDVTLISSHVSPCSNDVTSAYSCIASCQSDAIRNLCSCRPFWSKASKESRTRVCTMKQHISCVMEKLEDFSRTSAINCSCVVPCSFSEFHVDYSFSDLFQKQHRMNSAAFEVPSSSNLLPEAKLIEMKDDRCRSANIRARTSREIWHEDTEQMIEMDRSLDDLDYQMKLLQVNLRHVAQQLHSYIGTIQPRIAFQLHVGLAGIRKAFSDGFASAFEMVLQRSLRPLVAGTYETVAHLERSVKQLLFTSTKETILRKVVYFMSDNELSGKLELAIQTLDNLTKVHDSLLNAEPMSSLDLTPERHYDIHLVPYDILSDTHASLKTHYSGISESIAGVIEHILSLKGLIKDVYQNNLLNETAFHASRTAFIHRTLQVQHFADMFESEVIQRSLNVIDAKIDSLKRTNETMSVTAAKLTQSFDSLQLLINAAYTEPYDTVLRFTQEVQSYTREANALKSTVSDLGLQETTSRAVAALVKYIDDIQVNAAELTSYWTTIEESVKSIWRQLLLENTLQNFYRNLYNDVRDMINHPQRADMFKALFFHPKMLGSYPSTRAAAHGISGHTPSDFYTLLNADVPAINFTIKVANVTLELSRFIKDTDVAEILRGRTQRLTTAFDRLTTNLAAFQSNCELSQDLISENVVSVTVKMADALVRKREEHPTYSLFMLLGHLGGLLALFLGASVISCLELIDVTFQSICASRRQATMTRKSPDSNHVLFKPVDMRDDIIMTSSSPSLLHMPPPRSSPNRHAHPPAITLTKVKVDATHRAKHGHKQAETKI